VPLGGDSVRGRAQVGEKVCENLAHGLDSVGSPAIHRKQAAISREQCCHSLSIEPVDRYEQVGDWRLVHETAIVLDPG
jgi:hypothetical protein